MEFSTQKQSSQEFQILIDEDNFKQDNKQLAQIGDNNQHNKSVLKSLMVSMIEDDDIINDYFLAMQKSQKNAKQQNISKQGTNQSDPIKLKNRNQTHPLETPQKQQQPNNQSPLKRAFHYIKTTTQQQSQALQQQQIKLHQQQRQQQTSRLALQKQKYNLSFQQVYGQIFIYISQCQLIGYSKQEYGYFLLTNYRVIFFKFIPEQGLTKKRVDLPFGLVRNVQYAVRRKEIVFNLHYEHFWKFCFDGKEDFEKIKIMLELYAKTKDIKSSFAFSYALKAPEFKKSAFQILKEYIRMKLSDVSLIFPNEGFKLSETYPQYICLPQQLSEGSKQVIKSICQNFKRNTLPVLTFRFGGDQWAGLWLSGTHVEDHKLNQKQLKQYYSYMRNTKKNRSLHVYDCNSKSSKGLMQSSLDNKIKNHWFGLAFNSQIKGSYNSIVQAYLVPTKSFFSDVIASKWYDMVLHLLKCSYEVVEKLTIGETVLIKEDETREKSLMVSALVQIILQPFYRTYKGFKYLVMKQFISFGFKFASRTGNRQPDGECPTFILFLDAVSQLVHLNPLCFQWNHKYLGKLSNLMYTNIFGTFIADSPKEFFLSPILQQTVQIWPALQSQITKNPYYEIKNGMLANRPHGMNDLRLWQAHFLYMTSQPKDVYKMHPLAESTTDYVPLQCLKLKNENNKLKSELQKQRKQIIRLKQQLSVKNSISN